MKVYEKPLNQEFNLEGVMHISVEDAYELVENDEAFFIDVREEDEFRKEFFDFQNVFFHPMSAIMDRLQYIPKEIPLIVVCENGNRSTKVANVLNKQGFTDVANMDGGINTWKAKGFPIVENGLNKLEGGDSSCSPSSCGCGCSGCD
jgi:rhodanese-related sulfurtransferase